jgi:hypothetical protein
MKKLLLIAVFAMLGCFTTTAQELKFGAGASLPMGSTGDFSSFGIYADAAYLYEVADDITVGPKVGFGNLFGKDDAGSYTYLAIGGTGRIMLGDSFLLGTDLGYAIAITANTDGGFLYRPTAGYVVNDAITVLLSYQGISVTGGSYDTINVGVEFGL